MTHEVFQDVPQSCGLHNRAEQALLALPPGQVHLWLAFTDEFEDPGLLKRHRAMLTQDEQRQEQFLHLRPDRQRYVLTRSLVRSVLSRYAKVAPRDWSFVANAHGKPRIAAAPGGVREIEFNISHTRGLIIVAIARGHSVGVDVENVRCRRAPLETVDLVLSPSEIAALDALPGDRKDGRFFQYWTLKEAYLKALGIGISVPLTGFGFDIPHEGETSKRISLRAPPGELTFHGSLHSFFPTADHLVAVCVCGPAETDALIIARKFLSLEQDEAFPLNLQGTGNDAPFAQPRSSGTNQPDAQ